jgi:hypothetical protein
VIEDNLESMSLNDDALGSAIQDTLVVFYDVVWRAEVHHVLIMRQPDNFHTGLDQLAAFSNILSCF